MKYSILILVFVFMVRTVSSQTVTIPRYLAGYKTDFKQGPCAANLKWFRDAQFGMFIHYGLYSLLEKGEWVQLLDTIPLNEYALLQNKFTAENFDAKKMVTLAKKAGMKYITVTAKHHDGFCLFKTAQTEFNSLNSPVGRDLVGELYMACEREKIGLFIYYSYAADWKHSYFYDRSEGWENARPAYPVKPAEYLYKEPSDFRRYIDYVHDQLRELFTQYPNIAGIWFDPIMGYYARPDLFPINETYTLIRELSPHALISFKQGANGDEDFVAPERGGNAQVGQKFEIARKIYELNKEKPKEVCNTMQPHLKGFHGGSTWGYNKAIDGRHLKTEDVRKLLSGAKENGYNLLLNIGPLPDGSVHPEDINALSNLK